eukprot:Nk52_evm8s96 gene=Nk52_evmTU8s96
MAPPLHEENGDHGLINLTTSEGETPKEDYVFGEANFGVRRDDDTDSDEEEEDNEEEYDLQEAKDFLDYYYFHPDNDSVELEIYHTETEFYEAMVEELCNEIVDALLARSPHFAEAFNELKSYRKQKGCHIDLKPIGIELELHETIKKFLASIMDLVFAPCPVRGWSGQWQLGVVFT